MIVSKASHRHLLEVHDKFEQASTMEARDRGEIEKCSKVSECIPMGYAHHIEIITIDSV